MQTQLKYIASFFKRDWQLEDYPFREREQKPTGVSRPFRDAHQPAWLVHIPGWLRMIGSGNTREDAYADLQRKFDEYKHEGNRLPRPGTKVPIQFSPRLKIEQYEEVARDFFRTIFDVDYNNVLITDGSSLWDFPMVETKAELTARVEKAYSIDITDIEHGNLAEIFKKIKRG